MTKSNEGCWVDVFEKPWFAGKLLRLRGPGRFGPVPRAGSVIVGPNARLIRVGEDPGDPLQPRQIIPDRLGKLKDFQLTRVG